jgi:DNA-binding MarR family transcriptional regulator
MADSASAMLRSSAGPRSSGIIRGLSRASVSSAVTNSRSSRPTVESAWRSHGSPVPALPGRAGAVAAAARRGEHHAASAERAAELADRDAGDDDAVDGMRPRHLIALTLLRDHGPMAQAALGGALRLDPSNVVALLNDLEARGLMTRRRDPEDRRRHIVALSDGGTAALDRAEAGLAAVEDALLGGLSADERQTLHDLLLHASGDRLPDCAEGATAEDQPAC